MGQQYSALDERQQEFIEAQPMFFVATAAPEGRVNLSPKGLDSLRILDPNHLVWLSLTGSGNETAAHLQKSPRMTLMFCAFAGRAKILRLYGQAKVFHPRDAEFKKYSNLFPDHRGARQIYYLNFDLVQTSCGFGVPLMEYKGQREDLHHWTVKKENSGIENYWKEKNSVSIDGYDTRILDEPS